MTQVTAERQRSESERESHPHACAQRKKYPVLATGYFAQLFRLTFGEELRHLSELLVPGSQELLRIELLQLRQALRQHLVQVFRHLGMVAVRATWWFGNNRVDNSEADQVR